MGFEFEWLVLEPPLYEIEICWPAFSRSKTVDEVSRPVARGGGRLPECKVERGAKNKFWEWNILLRTKIELNFAGSLN